MFSLSVEELEDRILKALPVKNKDELFLKMFFGETQTIYTEQALDFYRFYIANDTEARYRLLRLNNDGKINYTNKEISIKD